MLVERQTTETGVERRRDKRVALLHSATLRAGERIIDCVIRDISVSGARLDLQQLDMQQPPAPEQTLVLDIAEAGVLSGRIVWRQAAQAGFQFLDGPDVVKSCFTAAWGRHSAFE
jgi:hypothetical protein